MGRIGARAGLIAALLVGCTGPEPLDPLERALVHRALPEDRVSGPGAEALAAATGLTVGEGAWVVREGGHTVAPRWYVRAEPPEDLPGWLAVATDGASVATVGVESNDYLALRQGLKQVALPGWPPPNSTPPSLPSSTA